MRLNSTTLLHLMGLSRMRQYRMLHRKGTTLEEGMHKYTGTLQRKRPVHEKIHLTGPNKTPKQWIERGRSERWTTRRHRGMALLSCKCGQD